QFGAFVELAPGVDGLVHVSRLVLDRRISHPRQVVSIDDEVEVTVVELDPASRRIGLSLVERAKAEQEAAELAERRDSRAPRAKPDDSAGFGTLGDLLRARRPQDR